MRVRYAGDIREMQGLASACSCWRGEGGVKARELGAVLRLQLLEGRVARGPQDVDDARAREAHRVLVGEEDVRGLEAADGRARVVHGVHRLQG